MLICGKILQKRKETKWTSIILNPSHRQARSANSKERHLVCCFWRTKPSKLRAEFPRSFSVGVWTTSQSNLGRRETKPCWERPAPFFTEEVVERAISTHSLPRLLSPRGNSKRKTESTEYRYFSKQRRHTDDQECSPCCTFHYWPQRFIKMIPEPTRNIWFSFRI